ncbi:hypothetical protein SAMN04489844_1937 [Nocardioides exalbidus]|uniref:DUF2231 domain-containing protein n=1 Tax=Nocardioides exalbidus TaxID=402596 RepID=A0A1H4QX21_9ACTN|nr:DUF2231 domain-containing protein [Nocardioides exalbidus]SEC24132.1 hypothetical protein SAMN04489844_1937 [Nocardioides exalbidus]
MFDLINGLPVHPLVVHAVVVLLPLACLGTIALAVRPAWRERYGLLVVACAALSTALIPVATSSGEALETRVGDPGVHAQLGDQLIWFAVPLLVLSAAMVWLDRRASTSPGATGGRSPVGVVRAVSVLALVAALAASVQVYRVGDSGAHAVWGDQVGAGK